MDDLRTLTVVKTDIRGFTDRVEQLTSRELATFLRDHRILVADSLRKYGARVIKELGDSFLLTFESSTNAILACIALQRELEVISAGQASDIRMEVRIAVSAGDILVQEGDIFGTPVNTAARIEALTPAGEIYLTEAAYQNLNRQEVATEYVGVFPLKGILDPVRVYRTTFRHQTRVLKDVCVMFTDLTDFTAFAETADLRDVEAVLETWDRIHREVTAEHDGAIRQVMSDSYFLTFNNAPDAFAAWVDIVDKLRAVNEKPGCPKKLEFSAGLDVGELRIFRSAIYGPSANRASVLESCASASESSLLVARKALAEELDAELRERLDIHVMEPDERRKDLLDRYGVQGPIVAVAR